MQNNNILFNKTMILLFPPPQIYPLSGPVEGGTLVTIEGSNLGTRETDIRGRVYIGAVPCEVSQDDDKNAFHQLNPELQI